MLRVLQLLENPAAMSLCVAQGAAVWRIANLRHKLACCRPLCHQQAAVPSDLCDQRHDALLSSALTHADSIDLPLGSAACAVGVGECESTCRETKSNISKRTTCHAHSPAPRGMLQR